MPKACGEGREGLSAATSQSGSSVGTVVKCQVVSGLQQVQWWVGGWCLLPTTCTPMYTGPASTGGKGSTSCLTTNNTAAAAQPSIQFTCPPSHTRLWRVPVPSPVALASCGPPSRSRLLAASRPPMAGRHGDASSRPPALTSDHIGKETVTKASALS